MKMMSLSSTGINWLSVCLLGVVWGSAFMAIAVALNNDFPPLFLAASRVVIGALVIGVIIVISGHPFWPIINQKHVLYFIGIIGTLTVILPFALLSWGIQYVSSSFAGISIGAIPLIVIPLAYVFNHNEHITLMRVFGVILGFIGLIIMVDPKGAQNIASGDFLGKLACIGAAICYAVGAIVTRRAPKIPPICFAAAILIWGAVILLPLSIMVEGYPNVSISWASAGSVFYLGSMATGLAAILRIRVIQSAGPVFMSQTSYHIPLWSAFFGFIFLDEPITASILTALGLIILGIILTQTGAIKKD